MKNTFNTFIATGLVLFVLLAPAAWAMASLQIAVSVLAAAHFGNIGVRGFRWLATNRPLPLTEVNMAWDGHRIDTSAAASVLGQAMEKQSLRARADATLAPFMVETTKVNIDELQRIVRTHSDYDEDVLRGFVAGGAKDSQGNDQTYRGD